MGSDPFGIYVGGTPTGFFFFPPFFFAAFFFVAFFAIQPLLSVARRYDLTTSSPCGVTENCPGLSTRCRRRRADAGVRRRRSVRRRDAPPRRRWMASRR